MRLKFKAGPYGPYAENLRHALHAIEGHFVASYADGGDIPDKTLELVSGAQREARRLLTQHKATRDRFYRVADLIDDFESPFGLELLSTVHWIAKANDARTREEVAQLSTAGAIENASSLPARSIWR